METTEQVSREGPELRNGTHTSQYRDTNGYLHINILTDHEELAEGDVGENVVCLILAAGEAGLLPEVREVLQQRPAGSQI